MENWRQKGWCTSYKARFVKLSDAAVRKLLRKENLYNAEIGGVHRRKEAPEVKFEIKTAQ